MTFILLLIMIALILLFFLKIFSFFISESMFSCREDVSSYECGFEHHGMSRVPFSLRYFLLTLVFLLFDLEIVLMLFIPLSVFSFSFFSIVLFLVVFISILLFSLLYEWSDGSLEWVV